MKTTLFIKILKLFFSIGLSIEFLQVGKDAVVSGNGFLETLFQSIPKRILLILGSIAGVIFIIRLAATSIISVLEKWKLSKIKIKHEVEGLERDSIDTDIHRQKLSDENKET